jgi:hypothetical protein
MYFRETTQTQLKTRHNIHGMGGVGIHTLSLNISYDYPSSVLSRFGNWKTLASCVFHSHSQTKFAIVVIFISRHHLSRCRHLSGISFHSIMQRLPALSPFLSLNLKANTTRLIQSITSLLQPGAAGLSCHAPFHGLNCKEVERSYIDPFIARESLVVWERT